MTLLMAQVPTQKQGQGDLLLLRKLSLPGLTSTVDSGRTHSRCFPTLTRLYLAATLLLLTQSLTTAENGLDLHII